MSCMIPEHYEPVHTIPARQAMRYFPQARTLAEMTTIGVGGSVAKVANVHSREEFIAALTETVENAEELLVVGGGSNILASDADFPGTVVHDTRAEIEILSEDSCGGARMRVSAGTPWDEVVVYAIEHGWMGLECLSGIPGTAGAAPVQNIGAYGQDVSGTIAAVRTFDRKYCTQRTFFRSDLDFGYRYSVLKESILSGRWGNLRVGSCLM
ncbi:FAD-binding protein [Arcanobacterium hippocoleae]|uniref:FAD-binding protein n=1 Tax=Arcanobacterium hippocoleae TaxID=149017 RepID=UPI00334243EA